MGIRNHTAELIIAFHNAVAAIVALYGIPENRAKMLLYLRTIPTFTIEHELDYVQFLLKESNEASKNRQAQG